MPEPGRAALRDAAACRSGMPAAADDLNALVLDLRRRNVILAADLELARAETERLQRAVRPPVSRGQQLVRGTMRVLGRVDRSVSKALGPRVHVVPGTAPTASDSPQELLRSAGIADSATVDSFAAQPTGSALLRGYQRCARRVLATGVRAYRRARRLGGRR